MKALKETGCCVAPYSCFYKNIPKTHSSLRVVIKLVWLTPAGGHRARHHPLHTISYKENHHWSQDPSPVSTQLRFSTKSWADTRGIVSSASTIWPWEEKWLSHSQTASSVNYPETPCLVCLLRDTPARCLSISVGIAGLTNREMWRCQPQVSAI